MFDRKWAYRNGDSVELQQLPYFFYDAQTDQMLEMTTITPERRKELGWYDVVYAGNRDMRFIEEPGQIQYNSTTDEVQVISFQLKKDWRELLIDRLVSNMRSSGSYEENKSKIEILVREVEKYFRSEKYEAEELYTYAQSMSISTYDVLSYANRNRRVFENNFVYTDLYDVDTKENIIPKKTMLQYIWENQAQFDGKKIACIGLNSMSSGVFLKTLGKRVTVVDNNFSPYGTNAFHSCTGAAIYSIINNVHTPFVEVEDYDFSEVDVLIFDMAFTVNVAQKNFDLMKAAKAAGKEVLVFSISLWNNQNPYVKIDETEFPTYFTSLYEYDGAHVFTLT